MNIARLTTAGLFVSLSGCFSPSVPAETGETDGTASETDMAEASSETGMTSLSGTTAAPDTAGPTSGADDSAGHETNDSGTSETGEETGTAEDTAGNVAPVVELTVNGTPTPGPVEQASEIVIEVATNDADGTVETVEFLFDGEAVAAPVESMGDTYTTRFIVSGADNNGAHIVEAIATDNDGNTGDASSNIQFDLPDGGLVEAWSFDNGEGGSVLGLHPTAEGDELVWTGQVFVEGDQDMRIDRIVGPAWQGNTTNDDDQGADVHPLPSGGYIAASAAGDAFDLETRLRRYSPNGTSINAALFDGSDNGESNWPLGVELDDAGDYYILGAFVGPQEFESYLLKSNSNLTQDWRRSLSASPQTDGTPFVHDFDVQGDGRIALAGADESRMWIAILDADGDVEDQLTLVSEFDQSIAYDVAWTSNGNIVVAGTTNEGSGWSRFIRMYDEALLEQWTYDGPANGDFAMAVTADDHGHTVVASTENCEFDGVARFDGCRLILRSYSEEGQLRWQHNAEGGADEFLGPLLFRPGSKADIDVDRYGYVYVSAFHERPLGGGATRPEWWAEQHHP